MDFISKAQYSFINCNECILKDVYNGGDGIYGNSVLPSQFSCKSNLKNKVLKNYIELRAQK